MGWLTEKVCFKMTFALNRSSAELFCFVQEQTTDGTVLWKPTFAAVTQQDLLLYSFAPTVKSEWASPRRSRPLIATRLILN